MIKLVVASMALAVCAPALADNTAIHRANNQFDVEAVRTRSIYHEPNDGSMAANVANLDSEQGHLNGVRVDYRLQENISGVENVYMQARYQHFGGNTIYDGHLQPGNTPFVSNTSNQADDLALRAGRGFALGRYTQFTPYAELGHHRWHRDIAPGSTANVTETYNHTTVGVGALLQQAVTDDLVVGVDASASWMAGATMDLVGGYDSMQLGRKPVYNMGLDVDYHLTPDLHLRGGVDVQRFEYGASNVVPTVYGNALEPASRTVTGYAHAGIAWDMR